MLGLRYKRNKVAARVIRIDQLSPGGEEGLVEEALLKSKISHFSFLLPA